MTATEVQVSRRPWVVLVAMSAAVTIVIFNSSAINVALPTMATELGLSAAAMRLVVVINSVTFAAMLLPAERERGPYCCSVCWRPDWAEPQQLPSTTCRPS